MTNEELIAFYALNLNRLGLRKNSPESLQKCKNILKQYYNREKIKLTKVEKSSKIKTGDIKDEDN